MGGLAAPHCFSRPEPFESVLVDRFVVLLMVVHKAVVKPDLEFTDGKVDHVVACSF